MGHMRQLRKINKAETFAENSLLAIDRVLSLENKREAREWRRNAKRLRAKARRRRGKYLCESEED